MFTLDLIINPIILIVSVIVGAVVGFLINRVRVAKCQSKIMQLEREMVDSHAEILDIQRQYVRLESQLEAHSIPVISMKKLNGKENSKEKATN